MFRIGEFAELAGVSAKQLRHYDALGVFRPAWVDHTTAYRFYSPAQLPQLHRIVALRHLGVGLAEIVDHIHRDEPLDDVLARRREQLERERDEAVERLRRIDGAPGADVVVRHVDAQLVASLRVEVRIDGDLEPLFDELEAHVRDEGGRADRPPVSIDHCDDGDVLDVEIAVPITHAIGATDRIRVRVLEPCLAATALHVGGYATLPAAEEALDRFVERTGRTAAGPRRTVYLQFGAAPALRLPGRFLVDADEAMVTELHQPIEPPQP